VVTDGFIGFDKETIGLIRSHLGSSNLFAFGIGTSVNRHLIEGMARAGQGEPFIVTQPSEVKETATRFRDLVSSPVLTKIRVTAEGCELSGIEPSPHPDVFANRPLLITGKWSGEPKGRILVRGIAGNGEAFEKVIDLAEAAAKGLDHPALPVLWARERVRRLEDEQTPWDSSRGTQPVSTNPETVREITSLGLSYSLLTPYTSFVAVDETPRHLDSTAQTVKQPLPLPQGVTDAAVGSAPAPVVVNGSVPEPGAIGLISLLTVLLMLQRKR
jgi:Ca-activated chloride channel family protein